MTSLSTKVWRVGKYALAAVLVVVAAVLGIGWYSISSAEKAMAESAFIQSLEHAEKGKGDVLKILFDGMVKGDKAEAKLVIRWLSARVQRGELPYLYAIGLYHGKLDRDWEKLKGLEYLATAALVYRVDQIQCRDPSAAQAVPIFEGAIGLGGVRDNLKTKPEIRNKVVASALSYEEKRTDRGRPDWICRHGIKPSSSELSTEIWQAHRQKVRADFERSF